jgi:hypothetical protein
VTSLHPVKKIVAIAFLIPMTCHDLGTTSIRQCANIFEDGSECWNRDPSPIDTSALIDGNGPADWMSIFRLLYCFANAIRFSKIYRVYSFNLSRFSLEFVVIAAIYFVSFF